MERNEAADRFVNCVVKRSNKDMVMKTVLVISTLVFPASLATILSLAISIDRSDVFIEDSYNLCIIIACMVECVIASFLLYSMVRRSDSHIRRDVVWMESLRDYIASHGGDTEVLSEISGRSDYRLIKAITLFSGFFFLVIVAYVLYVVFILVGLSPAAEISNRYDLVVTQYIVLLLQIAMTLLVTRKYTFSHEQDQVAFTDEFSRQAATFGLEIEPMQRIVKESRWYVTLILTFLTLGVYMLFLLPVTCYKMNRHLYNQWGYEDKLVRAIIEREGGKGIEGITPEDDMNPALRLIKNIL